jgi:hypothetical protein
MLHIFFKMREQPIQRFLIIFVLLALDNDLLTMSATTLGYNGNIARLLAAIDVLIPALFREVLFRDEMLSAVVFLGGSVFVFLGNAVNNIILYQMLNRRMYKASGNHTRTPLILSTRLFFFSSAGASCSWILWRSSPWLGEHDQEELAIEY